MQGAEGEVRCREQRTDVHHLRLFRSEADYIERGLAPVRPPEVVELVGVAHPVAGVAPSDRLGVAVLPLASRNINKARFTTLKLNWYWKTLSPCSAAPPASRWAPYQMYASDIMSVMFWKCFWLMLKSGAPPRYLGKFFGLYPTYYFLRNLTIPYSIIPDQTPPTIERRLRTCPCPAG